MRPLPSLLCGTLLCLGALAGSARAATVLTFDVTEVRNGSGGLVYSAAGGSVPGQQGSIVPATLQGTSMGIAWSMSSGSVHTPLSQFNGTAGTLVFSDVAAILPSGYSLGTTDNMHIGFVPQDLVIQAHVEFLVILLGDDDTFANNNVFRFQNTTAGYNAGNIQVTTQPGDTAPTIRRIAGTGGTGVAVLEVGASAWSTDVNGHAITTLHGDYGLGDGSHFAFFAISRTEAEVLIPDLPPAVPEPATAALALVGLASAATARGRRSRAAR